MTPIHPRAALTGAVLIAAVAVPAPAQIVSPNDRAVYEGSSGTTYPLGRHDCRLQQIHADLGPGARTIQGHAYRRDAIALRGGVAAFQSELSIELSIAAVTPDAASRTFAQNAGPNPSAVLPRKLMSFPATARPGAAPAASFDLRIPYATPFVLPAQTSAVCVDITVHGNLLSSGPNRNFTPGIDAHELTGDGTVEQPGYRFGSGCAPAAGGGAHTGALTLRRTPADLELDIASRNGVASTATTPAFTALIFGTALQSAPWPFKTGCTMLVRPDVVVTLPGANDTSGSWDGTMTGLGSLQPGRGFQTQLVAGGAATGDLTLSDASSVVAPPLGPGITVSRVASGSDRTSPTGTVSTSVPVTEFF